MSSEFRHLSSLIGQLQLSPVKPLLHSHFPQLHWPLPEHDSKQLSLVHSQNFPVTFGAPGFWEQWQIPQWHSPLSEQISLLGSCLHSYSSVYAFFSSHSHSFPCFPSKQLHLPQTKAPTLLHLVEFSSKSLQLQSHKGINSIMNLSFRPSGIISIVSLPPFSGHPFKVISALNCTSFVKFVHVFVSNSSSSSHFE